MFSSVSNVLVSFNEAEVTEFLKYCFRAKLINRLSSKKHYLMPLFLSPAGNIRKFFVGFEDYREREHNLVLPVKVPLSNILQNTTICSWKS